MAEQSDFNQPNLPIELFRYIAANAHPAAAAKLRRLSWAHCAAITTADLATAAARHIWKGRNTHVADLWPKIYRRYGDFPDIVYLVLEALVELGAHPLNGGLVTMAAACKLGHTMVVKLLLAHGVDGSYMAKRAAYLGHVGVLKVLLDAGVECNTENGRPLALAVAKGSRAIVDQLLHKGGNIYADELLHATVLRSAATKGHAQILQLLLEHRKRNYQQDVLDSALWAAARAGEDQTMRILIDHGANFHANSDMALFIAASNGRVQIVETLLAVGAGHLEEAISAAQGPNRDEVMSLLIAASGGNLIDRDDL